MMSSCDCASEPVDEKLLGALDDFLGEVMVLEVGCPLGQPFCTCFGLSHLTYNRVEILYLQQGAFYLYDSK